MARIGADLDQLRATIAAFRQGSAHLNEASQQALQAMQSMQSGPWAGRHRQQAEAIWTRIQTQLSAAVDELERLTARTERFANNLEAASSRFGDGVAVISGHDNISGKHIPTVPPPSGDGNNFQQLPYCPFESGPTTVPGVLANTAGCTNYVLRRVNLNDMGQWFDAHTWNDSARNAGYVVSDAPPEGARGSVMVFEPGVAGTHAGAGHVAYVEQVVRDPDGTLKVTISEANPVYSNGGVVWGTHTPPTTRTLALQVGEDGKVTSINGQPVPSNGVSFILGRRAI